MGGVTKRILRLFGRFQRPAAWCLLVGGLVTFIGVITNLIVIHEARLATLLLAADLFVGGMGSVQEAENELDSEGSAA